ncbi:DUF6494 family protein [Methylotenera mobilis]|uniref:Uncharacterized protein n=1 Tax=Methylotenera mobilis (strain JLW8 / ATCC BAA-1282 / DSM 17540) TaxID=583345 RepID=C6WVT8_METML|nr:DUF6494 family protein [Methylotenera mobilis]ACT48037.1 conserved hypothetical protein [Methylotenera mobilis JLW8]
MNNETFNMSIRQFLKMAGINSQREIEQAVARANANNTLKGNEHLPVKMTLSIDALNLNVSFDGSIDLN